MESVKSIIVSMRPRQWTKNGLIFAALIFSGHLRYLHDVLITLAGFGLFCLVSGCVYIFNDVLDIKYDIVHPEKKNRPIPSGKLSKEAGLSISFLGCAIGILLSFAFDYHFGIITASYFILQILYTVALKKIVLLDVFSIALGFVMRAVAGAYIIHVEISPWLLICTLLLSLFLALCKRRHELAFKEAGSNSRSVLDSYSLEMIDQMINIVGSGTVISYALYTMWESTIKKFGTNKLIFTVPFVLFGIFRYLYIVHKKKEGGSPERILLTDVPLIINIILYAITASAIIYLTGKI